MCSDCKRHAEERNRKYILTEGECVKKGGHEYRPPEQDMVFGTAVHPTYRRTCIYCGFEQQGYQPDIVWG